VSISLAAVPCCCPRNSSISRGPARMRR
jgi:hypothetical protein